MVGLGIFGRLLADLSLFILILGKNGNEVFWNRLVELHIQMVVRFAAHVKGCTTDFECLAEFDQLCHALIHLILH